MATKHTKESKYLNATPIEKLLEDSKHTLKSVDTLEATRIFKRNWVDTVRDLRLLHRERELATLVRINDKLLKWLASECEKTFADDTSPDLQMFIYQYDFDKNGIIYGIATDFGSSAWANPGISGKISVHFSSIMHDSQPPYSILGRSSVRTVTKPEKNSWLIVDLTPKLVKPSHYTLKHYSTWDTEALRSWTLEGSSDGGQTWTLLARHKADASLNAKGATSTWRLADFAQHHAHNGVLDQFYSHFRLLQTDFNSNRHYYLACSGFELYGAMKDMDDAKSQNRGNKASGGTLTFLPSYDFDTNGIVYWLGTARGTQPWKNPGIRGAIRVLQSSLAKDSRPGYAALGRETVRCVTEPKKNSWFMIDFLALKVIPTHYTMRHYASFDTECVRNWRIEASNDSKNGYDGTWTLLMKHVNDTSINHKGATHTWQLPAHAVKNQAFSQYRIFQFGVNSNQHHYLPLSGFELYGTVVSGHLKPPSNPMAMNQAGIITQPPPNKRTRDFVHTADFDTNGLLYFLGVQGGARASYSNPADIGMVTVTSSSLMSDSQPLSALVGRMSTRCVTKPHQRSWMAINVKDVKMRLTHYTLRHYNSWDTEALRYWNLEGSNDGQSWIPIRQHMDDRALRKAGASHTWAVDTNQFFSHFRLYMTGRNSNNHWYLATSGMELYGKAFGGVVSAKADAQLSMSAVNSPVKPPMAMPNMAAMGGQGMPAMQMPNMPMMNMQAMGNMAQQAMAAQMSNQNLFGAVPNLNAESFAYVRDFDNNGLVTFLGTKCNTQQWQNPAQLGALSIRTSGLMHDSHPAHCIVGRQSVRTVTKPLKHAWVIIDFHDYAIRPTRYTLRHYNSWDTEALRNWRLEGSLDGEKWTVLREHHNDESLRFKGQSYTWLLRNVTGYYSQFRLFQFDKNSNNHYYLALSGFEIYGDALRQHSTVTWDEWPRNKSKHLQVDRVRNSCMNTGSEDTWQTVKSRQPLVFDKATGMNEFSVLCERVESTSNSWKFMAGIAPDEFTCNASRQWLGSQKSYAYIGGTGGKCFDNPKSLSYGSKWGATIGDVVTVRSNLKAKTIEFLLNGKSQGVAFDNFAPNGRQMFAAASITATGSRLRLMEKVTPRSKPPMSAMAQNVAAAPNAAFANMAFAPQNAAMQMPPPAPQPSVSIKYGWDANLKSPHLAIFPDGVTVTNKGSNDTWQGVVSQQVFSSGRRSFEIHIINDIKTSNQWKYIFGVAPVAFDPKRTAWLGSQNSWGYIGGTGGKCHSVGKSVAYGKRYGGQDRVRCVLDFNKHTIEFFRNDKSQGIAFNNLNGAVRPAVSLTGKGAAVRICNIV